MKLVFEFLQFLRNKRSMANSWICPYENHPPTPATLLQSHLKYTNLLDMTDEQAVNNLIACYHTDRNGGLAKPLLS